VILGSIDGVILGSIDGVILGSIDGAILGSIDGAILGSIDGVSPSFGLNLLNDLCELFLTDSIVNTE
jgi:outer membrane lipoprotein SlyB